MRPVDSGRRERGGATLVELMIVVAIVAILATIAVSLFFLLIAAVKEAEAPANMGTLCDGYGELASGKTDTDWFPDPNPGEQKRAFANAPPPLSLLGSADRYCSYRAAKVVSGRGVLYAALCNADGISANGQSVWVCVREPLTQGSSSIAARLTGECTASLDVGLLSFKGVKDATTKIDSLIVSLCPTSSDPAESQVTSKLSP